MLLLYNKLTTTPNFFSKYFFVCSRILAQKRVTHTCSTLASLYGEIFQVLPICDLASENRSYDFLNRMELLLSCYSPYLALSSGACGASIRASIPEL